MTSKITNYLKFTTSKPIIITIIAINAFVILEAIFVDKPVTKPSSFVSLRVLPSFASVGEQI